MIDDLNTIFTAVIVVNGGSGRHMM